MSDDTGIPLEAEATGWITPKTIILFLFWIAQVIFLDKHIQKIAQIRPKNEAERQRDAKYHCFAQANIKIDSFLNRIIIYFCCAPLLVLRFFSAAVILFVMQVWSFIIFLLIPTTSRFHRPILFFGTQICGYGLVACCSLLYIEKARPKVCYKKYLGPDWTPVYEGQSTNIFNHSAWIDTLTMMTEFTPAFVAKASVRNLPLVGYTAWRCGSLFIDRGNKEARGDMFAQIAARQGEAEAGVSPPLSIAPEGGTTNGTALIQFKRGAFAALKSVKPYGLHYTSTLVPMQSGILPFESHVFLMAGNLFASCYMKEMPVFKPNEYLWKHHLKEGEDKVDCYMRVIRQIMAENLNLNLAEIDIKEKFDYRAAIWPSKKKAE